LCAFVHIQGSMKTGLVSWTAMFCCLICSDSFFHIMYETFRLLRVNRTQWFFLYSFCAT